MSLQKICTLFIYRRNCVKNLQKVCSANACLKITPGYRKLKKARKYRRPEDFEDPFYYGVGPRPKVQSALQSLSTRGFGKELKSYSPPADIEDSFLKLSKKVFGSQLNEIWQNQELSDRVLKYKLLTKATETFGKDIPNPELHKIKTISDALNFFKEAVDGSYHLDRLSREIDQMPPNLHLTMDTPRFNPETDTFFDGTTAFPGRKRTVFTKTKEMFEKTIQWPNI